MNKKYAKVQSTRRSLIMSMISLVLCFAMLLGTTYAWFTDSVTSGKNQIVAGNLDVKLTHSNSQVTDETVEGATELFSVALWEPGVVAYENFKVANVGTLALKYKLELNAWNYNRTEEGKDLRDVIKVVFVPGGIKPETGKTEITRDQAQALFSGAGDYSFKEFQKTDTLYPVNNKPANDASAKSDDVFGVVAYWEPSDNDNVYNLNNGRHNDDGFKYNGVEALFLEFGICLTATQKDFEPDSFDNQYDVNATIPPLPVRFYASGKSGGIRRSYSGTTIDPTKVVETVDNLTGEPTDSVKIQIKTNDNTEPTLKKVVGGADVPAKAANKVMDDTFVSSSFPTEAVENQNQDDVLVLTLDINPIDATSNSLKLDVNLLKEATRTITDASTNEVLSVQSSTGNVTELTDAVTVTLQLDKHLKDVTVTHKHGTSDPSEFTSVDSLAEVEDGKFYYNASTGELTLKSARFSEYDISFTRDEVCRIGDTGYAVLDEALEAAKEGDVIEIMKVSDDHAIVVKGKDVTLNLQNIDASDVIVKDNAKVKLTGKGTLVAETEMGSTLDIVGGTYSNLTFKGTGVFNVTDAQVEKLIVAEGSNVTVNVKGGVIKDTNFAENATVKLTIEAGKFENFEKIAEGVNIDFKGGEFHLASDEKVNAFKEILTNEQYLYKVEGEGEEGWYAVAPCTYSPKNVTHHTLRYTVDGITKHEDLAHEFDENDVCTKCGFSKRIGKVQIHTPDAANYVCITDAGMTNKSGETVNSILGGAIEYNSGTKTLKLMQDVNVNQIDFTCDKSGSCGAILDLNGHVLTCNSWTALDIYANAKSDDDQYGYEGYSLVINDSKPDAVHNGKIYYAERDHYYTSIRHYKYDGYEWFKDGSTPNGEFITDYVIKGGIITNVSAGKYGSAGDPYDGGGLSTCGKTTVTFNAGTFAGINADGDVGAIAMGKTQSSENCKLFMNEGASIVGCSGGTAGVRMYGSGHFELNGGKFSYCSGWEIAHAVYTEESSEFIMNDGIIEHCYSKNRRPSVINLMGSGKTELLGGTITDCDAYAIIWNSDAKLVLDGVTIKNCFARDGEYGGFLIMEATFEGNPTLTIKGSTKLINNTTQNTPIADNVDSRVKILGGDFTQINNVETQDLLTSIDESFEGIQGGSFNNIHKEFVKAHLADGCAIVDNGNSTFTVTAQ